LRRSRPIALWALQKDLQRIDAELVEVKRRDAELVAAQKEEPLASSASASGSRRCGRCSMS
jgi:hypothetical protein